MYPIAFNIFGKSIHFYGVCIALGFICATLVMLYKRNRAGMTADQIFDLAIIALFTGIIGARLLHVIQNWESGNGLLWIFRIDQGGLVFYGGFLLAITCCCIYARKKKISMPALLDVTSPAIAIGHAFGRIGCFLQGCCFGKAAPADAWYAVRYPYHPESSIDPRMILPDGYTQALYPTQIWESLANFILCGVLLLLCKKLRRPGQIAGVYLITYAVIRFILEFFRGDNPELMLGLTTSQNIALFLMIPIGSILLVMAKEKKELELKDA